MLLPSFLVEEDQVTKDIIQVLDIVLLAMDII